MTSTCLQVLWKLTPCTLIAGMLCGAAGRKGTFKVHNSRLSRRSRNRGIDAKRLLGVMRDVGIGEPRRPQLPGPAATTAANSKEAALLVMEQRRQALEQGGAGIRPALRRRKYRLPLLVKYHKPEGLAGTMRQIRLKRGVEDLRTVVSFAGDQFELDLYHPVAQMPIKSSGLLLWSRSQVLTRELLNPLRRVVQTYKAEVQGVVQEEILREKMRAGVTMGVMGFETAKQADLKDVSAVPGSSLQDPRYRITVLALEGTSKVRQIIEACGHKVISLKRTGIGALSLDKLKCGGLAAATEEEEEWACQLAGLPTSEYPRGQLQSA